MSHFHSAHTYQAFEGLVIAVEKALANASIPAACGCQPGAVRHRLIQRLVEHLLGPYVVLFGSYVKQGAQPLEKMVGNLKLSGMTVSARDGDINISFRLFIAALKDFGVHWLHALLAILTLMTRIKFRGPVTVIMGIGIESIFSGVSDRRFINYCDHGPISPLNAGNILVQIGTAERGSISERVQYAKYPFHTLVASMPLKLGIRLALLFRHLAMPYYFGRALLRNPVLVLLSRDYAQSPMMTILNKLGSIDNIIFTNSNYSSQPLWSRAQRNYRTHMAWYSQNIIPFVYKSDEIVSDLPNYRHMCIDEHWVWTTAFKRYLEVRLAQRGPIHVVGPIVWYLPEDRYNTISKSNTIIIFDITPVSDQYAQSIGVLNNYYSSTTMLRFLQEILSVVEQVEASTGRRLNIRLKHKRASGVTHDRGYIEHVTALTNSRKIEIIPYDENIYSLVGARDISITIPYSSAAYIPSAMGRTSIYFDPTDSLLPSAIDQDILFISGEIALQLVLKKILSSQ
jgi:polysaccharide biosynthesis PFTS motif protein